MIVGLALVGVMVIGPWVRSKTPTSVVSWTLSLQRVFRPDAQEVRHVAFSPDGGRLVSGASAIALWDVQIGERLIDVPLGTPARAPEVAFSPDGKWVAGMANLVVMLWDARTGALVRELKGHTGYPVWPTRQREGRRAASRGITRT